MGRMCLYVLLNLLSVNIHGLSTRNENGHSYKIELHSDCKQAVAAITCPQSHDSLHNPIVPAGYNKAADWPHLTVIKLHDDMVVNITWQHIKLPDAIIDYGVMRLFLSVRGTIADVKCFNRVKNLTKANICILIVPENSAVLTIEIMASSDQSCPCDVTGMDPPVGGACSWKCSPSYPIWSIYTADIGRLACLKHRQTGEVTMDLFVREVTPNLLLFEFTAFINNPYTRIDAYLHTAGEDNPKPLLEFLDVRHHNGDIYIKVTHAATGYTTFYAKLCLQCTDEDWSLPCFITDDVNIQSKRYTTNRSNSTYKYELLSTKTTDIHRHPNVVILALTVVLIIVIMLATLLVYLRRRRIQTSTRRQKHKITVVEAVPINSYNTETYKYENEACLCRILEKDLSGYTEFVKRSMFLYHPDSPSHKKQVEYFVQHLNKQDIELDGVYTNNYTENWRDFAEKSGDIYTNIVIIYSKGLHDLYSAYFQKEKCIKKKENWECLLRQRHQEYIPCVALLKLKSLHHEREDFYHVYFVLFDNSDRTELEKLISNYFSFIQSKSLHLYCLLNIV